LKRQRHPAGWRWRLSWRAAFENKNCLQAFAHSNVELLPVPKYLRSSRAMAQCRCPRLAQGNGNGQEVMNEANKTRYKSIQKLALPSCFYAWTPEGPDVL
ncbi:hypothetical protein ACFQ48_07180, partial [Hymenobacter caeli]|uniref:hypothetical protein n=1 Tax=Hymenobacter caeli TaxID=2735894 RepID=UPI003643A612